jgi:serine/threonine-protein kinase
MKVTLTVTDGPNAGKAFTFTERDAFLVGRGVGVHFQPDKRDLYFSRFHFMVEINPPLCQLIDLGSRNGTRVNGEKRDRADLRNGDTIRAGRTMLQVAIEAEPEPVTEIWEPSTPTVVTPSAVADAPTIPGYRIVRELGHGGMGVVYLAVSEADGAEVALKVIVPNGTVTRRNIDKFVREASILKQLAHPNIVAFRDLGAARGVLYFTMDYVPGTDAQRMLNARGPWSIRSAVRVAMEVLKALEYAHGEGFVHRDIKPSNILIRTGKSSNLVKLADFGLARVYQSSQMSGLSQEGEFGGTPNFMPPEQITEYRNVTPASDQFALAATLYTLVTGQFIHDFENDGRPAIILVLEGEPIPIRERRPELPVELAAAIHRALEREPAQRFASCTEFADALRAFA